MKRVATGDVHGMMLAISGKSGATKRCRVFGKQPASAFATELDGTSTLAHRTSCYKEVLDFRAPKKFRMLGKTSPPSVTGCHSVDARKMQEPCKGASAPVRHRRQRLRRKGRPLVPRVVGDFPVDVWGRIEKYVRLLLRPMLEDPRHPTVLEPSEHLCHWPRLSLPDFCALTTCNQATAEMGRRRAPQVYGHVIICAQLFADAAGSLDRPRCLQSGSVRTHLRREASARGTSRIFDLAQVTKRGARSGCTSGTGTFARVATLCKRVRRFLYTAPTARFHMQHLDLTQAGHSPEESVAVACILAEAIATLPHLRLLFYPSTGWGSVLQHRQFLGTFKGRSDIVMKAKSC